MKKLVFVFTLLFTLPTLSQPFGNEWIDYSQNYYKIPTRFVFTLTGSEIPQEVQIQIMTVTGKVVREIDEMELGPLRIGNNMTEFAWDGKDEFGDQLANGVYLYRVKMKLNGTNIDRRESSVDKSFVRNFGKMYLLR